MGLFLPLAQLDASDLARDRLGQLEELDAAYLQIRSEVIPQNDPELAELGDDGWHAQAVQPWLEAASQNAEVVHHLNVIGMSCMKQKITPPYMIQSVWRDRLGHPQQWIGGRDPRRGWETIRPGSS